MIQIRCDSDECPPKLYRCFTQEQYALNLIENGIVRFGEWQTYREIEDNARKDATEGLASVYAQQQVLTISLDETGKPVDSFNRSGQVHHRMKNLSSAYLYCCSFPPEGDESLLPSGLGKYVVRINTPSQFMRDISEALGAMFPNGPSLVLKCKRVCYNKDEVVSHKPTEWDLFDLSLLQKPSKDKAQYEYRIFFINLNPANTEKYRTVNLNKPLDYADLLIRS